MENNLAFNLLYLLSTPGIGTARVNMLLEQAQRQQRTLNQILTDSEVMSTLLPKRQLEALLSSRPSTLEVWKRLQDMNVTLLASIEDEYPERLHKLLGKKAPPLVTVLGNHQLLNKASVGFCGSRKASNKGIQAAYDCAEQLSQQGINVVSGYAKGIDLTTHQAALEAGGTTTVVLPEGIFNFKIKPELKEVWDWRRVAVVSEFLPGLPWSVRNAMQRNATICALSQAMILIEARSTGGSIEAGRICLKMELPLFAADYAGMPETAQGNRELLEQGAQPLGKSRETHKANVGRVLAAIGDQAVKNNSKTLTDDKLDTQLSML